MLDYKPAGVRSFQQVGSIPTSNDKSGALPSDELMDGWIWMDGWMDELIAGLTRISPPGPQNTRWSIDAISLTISSSFSFLLGRCICKSRAG